MTRKNPILNQFWTILILGVILFIPLISAAEWDNVKSYDAIKKEVTITNWLGLGGELAKITLTDNSDYCLTNCYAEGTTELFHEGKVIQSLRFTPNVINSRKFLIQDGWITKEVPKTEVQCIKKESENKTEYEECFNIETGKEEIKTPNWIEFDNNKDYAKGVYNWRIEGIKDPASSTDWIASWEGKEVTEWAVWKSSYSVGFIGYYDMESKGEKLYGKNNFTNDFSVTDANCFRGKCFLFSGGNLTNWLTNITKNDQVTMMNYGNSRNFTWTMWIKANATFKDQAIFQGINETGSTVIGTIYIDSASGNLTWQDGWVNGLYSKNFSLNKWNSITMSYNSWNNNMSIYINGTLVRSGNTSNAGLFTTRDGNYRFGSYMSTSGTGVFSGYMDELMWWNRTLTDTEINELYNNGKGIAYSDISISLDKPSDQSLYVPSEFINVSCSIVGTNIANISLIVNNTFNKTVTSCSSGCSNTVYSKFPFGQYNWTCMARDTSNNEFRGSNQWFNVTTIRVNSVNYNTSSFETATETFTINASGMTNAYLVFNNTFYSTTITADVAKTSLVVPFVERDNLNKSFYWTFNSYSVNSTVGLYNQTENRIMFALCNATYDSKYINYTFKDEITNARINATMVSTFLYGLDTTNYKTLSYTSTVELANYSFCTNYYNKSLYIKPSITYVASGYPSKEYSPDSFDLYTNVTTHKTLFLLSSTDGIYVTFQVINSALTTISGAFINVSNSNGLMGATTTDDAGSATFFLNPALSTLVTVIKSGYPNYYSTITPSQSSYTITLGSSGTAANLTQEGIWVDINPKNEYLANQTTYPINVTWTHSTKNFQSYGFNITNSSGALLGNTNGSNSAGETLNLNIFTGNNTHLVLWGWYKIEGETTTFLRGGWTVMNLDGGDWSIAQFADDIITYTNSSNNMFGIRGDGNGFNLNIIIFLIIFITTGVVSWKFGITSPMMVTWMIFGLVLIFDAVLHLITNPVSAINHFSTVFAFIIAAAVTIKEVTGY